MTLAIVKQPSNKWNRIWWVSSRIPRRSVNWRAPRSKIFISIDRKYTAIIQVCSSRPNILLTFPFQKSFVTFWLMFDSKCLVYTNSVLVVEGFIPFFPHTRAQPNIHLIDSNSSPRSWFRKVFSQPLVHAHRTLQFNAEQKCCLLLNQIFVQNLTEKCFIVSLLTDANEKFALYIFHQTFQVFYTNFNIQNFMKSKRLIHCSFLNLFFQFQQKIIIHIVVSKTFCVQTN